MTTSIPFVHSNANHRLAMRAMVDKLIDSNFKYWRDSDDLVFRRGIEYHSV